jgi:transcriptional regulator with XRE-family HTH domain
MSPRRETAQFRRALGSAVLQRRRAQGLSQEDLGEVAGVDRTYVSGLESGKRNPTLETLLRLCGALDVPLSELILEAERGGSGQLRRRD